MKQIKNYSNFDLSALRTELLATSRDFFIMKHKKKIGELTETHQLRKSKRKIADIKRLIELIIKTKKV